MTLDYQHARPGGFGPSRATKRFMFAPAAGAALLGTFHLRDVCFRCSPTFVAITGAFIACIVGGLVFKALVDATFRTYVRTNEQGVWWSYRSIVHRQDYAIPWSWIDRVSVRRRFGRAIRPDLRDGQRHLIRFPLVPPAAIAAIANDVEAWRRSAT